MKKLLNALLALCCFLISCGPPESPEIPQSVPNVDANAAQQFQDQYLEAGYETWQAVAMGIGAGAAASASAMFRQTNSLPYNVNCDLPSTYIIAGNPYEDIGIMHNRLLNLYYSIGNLDTVLNKFETYDSIFYDQVLQTSSLSSLNSSFNRPLLYAELVADTAATNIEARLGPISNTNTDEDIFDLVTYTNSAVKDSVMAFFYHYKDMKENEATLKEITDFINVKITTILNENEVLSADQRRQVIYLTVLKHSNYYFTGLGL